MKTSLAPNQAKCNKVEKQYFEELKLKICKKVCLK